MSRSFAGPIALLLIPLAALVTTPAYAQGPRPISVGIGGGATVPLSDFADDVEAGFHVNGFLQYRTPGNPFGLRGELQYHRNGIKQGLLDELEAPPGTSGSNSITYVGAAALFEPVTTTGSVGWFLIGGVGNYNEKVSVDLEDLTASESESAFGFNGGAGLSFRSGQLRITIEGRYHTFKVNDSQFSLFPVSLNIVF